jgi:hypothetical protein
MPTDKPNCRLQKYRLTGKGRALAEAKALLSDQTNPPKN